jgi:hypothetical protein
VGLPCPAQNFMITGKVSKEPESSRKISFMMFESNFCKEYYRHLNRYIPNIQRKTIESGNLKENSKLLFASKDQEMPSSHCHYSSITATFYRHVRLTKEIALQ